MVPNDGAYTAILTLVVNASLTQFIPSTDVMLPVVENVMSLPDTKTIDSTLSDAVCKVHVIPSGDVLIYFPAVLPSRQIIRPNAYTNLFNPKLLVVIAETGADHVMPSDDV
jgi:hypothetical protein